VSTLNNWKLISNISLGIGLVIFIWGLIAFFVELGTLGQIPGAGEISIVTALVVATPHFIGASLLLVIGGVIYYTVNQDESDENFDEETIEKHLVDRMDRLEKNIDIHFTKIAQRLDKIEEKKES
jgi:hypothetical protein